MHSKHLPLADKAWIFLCRGEIPFSPAAPHLYRNAHLRQGVLSIVRRPTSTSRQNYPSCRPVMKMWHSESTHKHPTHTCRETSTRLLRDAAPHKNCPSHRKPRPARRGCAKERTSKLPSPSTFGTPYSSTASFFHRSGLDYLAIRFDFDQAVRDVLRTEVLHNGGMCPSGVVRRRCGIQSHPTDQSGVPTKERALQPHRVEAST